MKNFIPLNMEMIFGGVKYELRVEFKSLRAYVSKDGNKTIITDDKGCPIFDISMDVLTDYQYIV